MNIPVRQEPGWGGKNALKKCTEHPGLFSLGSSHRIFYNTYVKYSLWEALKPETMLLIHDSVKMLLI